MHSTRYGRQRKSRNVCELLDLFMPDGYGATVPVRRSTVPEGRAQPTRDDEPRRRETTRDDDPRRPETTRDDARERERERERERDLTINMPLPPQVAPSFACSVTSLSHTPGSHCTPWDPCRPLAWSGSAVGTACRTCAVSCTSSPYPRRPPGPKNTKRWRVRA